MPEPETPEAFRHHLQYLELVKQQNQAFGELLSRFGEPEPQTTEFLHKASGIAAARNPRFVLDPEEVSTLRAKNPALFFKIQPVYEEFLKDKAGLT